MSESNHIDTAAQTIAKIMVKREIIKSKQGTPPDFWNHEPWKKKFRLQIIAAHSLLKLYDAEAILNALKRKECSWQYSLRVKNMNDIFKEEQAKIDKQKKQIEEYAKQEKIDKVIEPTQFTKPVSFGQKSKLNRLD